MNDAILNGLNYLQLMLEMAKQSREHFQGREWNFMTGEVKFCNSHLVLDEGVIL